MNRHGVRARERRRAVGRCSQMRCSGRDADVQTVVVGAPHYATGQQGGAAESTADADGRDEAGIGVRVGDPTATRADEIATTHRRLELAAGQTAECGDGAHPTGNE